MGKELIIQPGLPKTGTTTLQNRIFKNHDEYLYLGKYNNSSHYSAEEKFKDKWLINFKRNLIAKDLPFFQEFDFEELLLTQYGDSYDNYEKLFLSEEDILSRCITPGNYGRMVRFGSPYQIFTKLKIISDSGCFSSVKIILVLRKQDDLLESIFAETYYIFKSFFGIKTPDAFVKNLIEERDLEETDSLLRYGSLVEFIDKLFGQDNVLILPYEKMKVEPESFLQEVSSFMGIESWTNACEIKTHLDNNRTSNMNGGKVAKVRSVTAEIARLKSKIIGNIPTGLAHKMNFINKLQKEKIIKINKIDKKNILSRYREENKLLDNRVKDISKFGYF